MPNSARSSLEMASSVVNPSLEQRELSRLGQLDEEDERFIELERAHKESARVLAAVDMHTKDGTEQVSLTTLKQD